MKLKNWGMGGYCPRAIVQGAIVRGAIFLDPTPLSQGKMVMNE